MDKLLSLLSTYLDDAAKIITAQGPKAWAATLDLIRMNAIYDLAIWALIVVGSTIALLKVDKWAKEKDDTDCYIAGIPFAIFLFLALLFGLFGGFETILGIFRPDLYVLNSLAHKAGIL